MSKANLIIAGDEIYAGIDENDVIETGPLKYAVVIQFTSQEQMRDAMQSGVIEFEWFVMGKS